MCLCFFATTVWWNTMNIKRCDISCLGLRCNSPITSRREDDCRSTQMTDSVWITLFWSASMVLRRQQSVVFVAMLTLALVVTTAISGVASWVDGSWPALALAGPRAQLLSLVTRRSISSHRCRPSPAGLHEPGRRGRLSRPRRNSFIVCSSSSNSSISSWAIVYRR